MNILAESLLPANGWEVVFDDGKHTRVPLIGWAFTPGKDSAEGKVVGVIPGSYRQVIYCEDVAEFLCYIPQGKAFP